MAFKKSVVKTPVLEKSKAAMTEEEDLPGSPEVSEGEAESKEDGEKEVKIAARSVVTLFPSQNKAIVKEGDEQKKVAYLIRRKDQVELIAPITGGPSVPLADWLAGKAKV